MAARSMPRLLAVLVVTSFVARPALAERMSFAWPVPAKVVVTDKVHQGGTTATTRYEATLTKQGDALALRLGKFEFLEVGGRDARDPAIRKQLKGTLEVASALPTILVSPEGRFLDVVDIEAMVDRILRSSTIPAKEKAALAKTLKAPAMVASMKSRSVEFWNVWVGLWTGADLEPGRTREVTIPVTMPNGAQVPRPVKISHQGPAGPPGNVHLSYESTLEAGASQAKLRGALQEAAKELAGPDGKPVDQEIEGLVLFSAGDVITDPQTLKPAAARSSRRTSVKMKGQPARNEIEEHEYTFDWSGKSSKGPTAQR